MALQKTFKALLVTLMQSCFDLAINTIEDCLNGSLLANKLEVMDCCQVGPKHSLTISGQIIHKAHTSII